MASVGLNDSPQSHSILETNNIDGLNDYLEPHVNVSKFQIFLKK